MLRINYSAHYIIGVYAASEVVRVILTTMDGKIIENYVKQIVNLPSKTEFMNLLIESINWIIKKAEFKKI